MRICRTACQAGCNYGNLRRLARLHSCFSERVAEGAQGGDGQRGIRGQSSAPRGTEDPQQSRLHFHERLQVLNLQAQSTCCPGLGKVSGDEPYCFRGTGTHGLALTQEAVVQRLNQGAGRDRQLILAAKNASNTGKQCLLQKCRAF
mmetsp:Transcript_83631/g.148127  ORF Transcript_83631/g.148127 Transcript_83631/m.148127 type:complete len:146 (-) Transcript_83631:904-1341(-)